MTSNPRIVEGGSVTFEETGSGKKPDTLEQSVQEAPSLPSPITGTEGTQRVVEAFKMLLNIFPNIGLKYQDFNPAFDQIITSHLNINFLVDNVNIHPFGHTISFPKKISSALARSTLVAIYGDYILQTDALPDLSQSEIDIYELASLYSEMKILDAMSNKEIKAGTRALTIKNPYLTILMAKPETRNFLTEAFYKAELDGVFNCLKPWEEEVSMSKITPLPSSSVLKYAQAVGEKEVKKYLAELSLLPRIGR